MTRPRKRLLLCNWADLDDPERRGGGVAVYLRALSEALAGRDDIEVSFLSAGLAHDIRRRPPRWRRLSRPGERPRRFEIVNSQVLAPGQDAFRLPAALEAPATEAAFADFLRAEGPFDAVHFHNLEGLPAAAPGVAARAGARVLATLHNYHPFCPQVNLWRRESEPCDDYRDGRECVACLPAPPNPEFVRRLHAAAGLLKRLRVRPGTETFKVLHFLLSRGLGLAHDALGRRDFPDALPSPRGLQGARFDSAAQAAVFRDRRARFVAALNRDCDAVLAVSERVREIAVAMGVAPERVRTAYIGTRAADLYAARRPAPRRGPGLRLAYLGYMRRDKGFPFLLEALEGLPRHLADRLALTVAAPRGAPELMARMERLSPRLAGLTYLDGYGHDQLDDILSDADCGVVPVMWEDNLPQVALEMHARRLPLLVSDRGGAQELSGAPGFVFRAGDAADFRARLAALIEGRTPLDAYWAQARAPTRMEDHVAALLETWFPEAIPAAQDA